MPSAPWLGALLADRDGKPTFTVVHNDGPSECAGVAPGDVAVALDGIALTAANCDRRLKNYRDGDTVELVFFRGDELMSTEMRLTASPATTVYLQADDAADAPAVSRRNAWLQPDQ